MLKKNPRDRPSINQILGLPFIKKRIANFYDKTMMDYEMNHTVLHGANILQQEQNNQQQALQNQNDNNQQKQKLHEQNLILQQQQQQIKLNPQMNHPASPFCW